MHSNRIIKTAANILSFVTMFIFDNSVATRGFLHSHDFVIKTNAAIPSVGFQSEYNTSAVSSKLHCVIGCAKDLSCVAFYAFPKDATTEANQRWECRKMAKRAEDEMFSLGNGSYGYLNKFSVKTTAPVPSFENCDYQTTTRTSLGIAAVYDCQRSDDRMTNIGILYDYNNDKWPQISLNCSRSLSHEFGLSGTLLQITENTLDSGISELNPICQNSERKWTNITCDETGTWNYHQGKPNVGCLPTTCFRNHGSRGVYIGTMNTSRNAVVCQRWESNTPNYHGYSDARFWEDSYNVTLAENFCRDPDATGTPWCYGMTGPRWEFCSDIPRCRRRYINLE